MNFGNGVVEIQQKYERERKKSGREKILNFGNHITEIPADRKLIVVMPLLK